MTGVGKIFSFYLHIFIISEYMSFQILKKNADVLVGKLQYDSCN